MAHRTGRPKGCPVFPCGQRKERIDSTDHRGVIRTHHKCSDISHEYLCAKYAQTPNASAVETVIRVVDDDQSTTTSIISTAI